MVDTNKESDEAFIKRIKNIKKPEALTRCPNCGKIIKISQKRGKKCTKCKNLTSLNKWIK